MSDLKLTDREWKGFFIGGKEGIFQIKATKSGIDKNKLKVSENGNVRRRLILHNIVSFFA